MHSHEDRIGAILRAQRAEIVPRWVQVVASSSRGRITATELERELAPILDQIIAGVEAGADSREGPFVEARALLAEWSRSRARQGFSTTETASSVFALKQIVLEVTRADEDPENALG